MEKKVFRQLAEHFEQVYFGGNWTYSNLQSQLEDVDFLEALQKIENLNTIAQLTYHIHYFVEVQMRVLKEGKLIGKDSESYNHPVFASNAQWQTYKKQLWEDAHAYIALLRQQEDDALFEAFIDPKYGNAFRNYLGIIEHTHYHLGQLALVKKLVKGN